IVIAAAVTKPGHRDLHQPANPLFAGLIIFLQPDYFLAQTHEPQPFFEITAFSMSLSRLRSGPPTFSTGGWHPLRLLGNFGWPSIREKALSSNTSPKRC